MQRSLNVLLVVSLLLAAASGWLLWRMAESTRPPAGQDIPSVVGGPFALVDQDGRARTDRDFRGRWVLLYFGYTYCPDVCPTTLAAMAEVIEKLGTDAARVTPVFVTVDPARDRPAVLKSYLASIGPGFVGLTGTPSAVAGIARAYRVYYAKHPLPGGGYSVDHSSVIYLVDPAGKFVKFYDADSKADAIADDLKARM